jgi:tetratricopeptide (TPR) repeat protein
MLTPKKCNISLLPLITLLFSISFPLQGQTDSSISKILDSGYQHFYKGDYSSATDIFNLVLKKDSSIIKAYDYLGLSMSNLGYCQEADQILKLGLDHDSNNIELLTHAAQTSFQCGFLSKSKAYYARIININPNQTRSIINLSQIFIQEASYDSAISILHQGLSVDSNSQQLHYLLGTSYLSKKKTSLAIEELEKAKSFNPAYFPATRDLAFAYLQADSLLLATLEFQYALSIQPENFNVKMNLANCYFKRKSYDNALSLYLSLEKDPYIPSIYVQEGLSYFYLLKYDTAAMKFRYALTIDSTLSPAYFNLGLSYMELQKYREAISAFKHAIRFSKSDMIANAYDRLGAAFYQLKSEQKSLNAYKMAIEENPRLPRVYFNMGVLYENSLRDYSKAVESYLKVISLSERSNDPNSVFFKAKQRVRFLRSSRSLNKQPK